MNQSGEKPKHHVYEAENQCKDYYLFRKQFTNLRTTSSVRYCILNTVIFTVFGYIEQILLIHWYLDFGVYSYGFRWWVGPMLSGESCSSITLGLYTFLRLLSQIRNASHATDPKQCVRVIQLWPFEWLLSNSQKWVLLEKQRSDTHGCLLVMSSETLVFSLMASRLSKFCGCWRERANIVAGQIHKISKNCSDMII